MLAIVHGFVVCVCVCFVFLWCVGFLPPDNAHWFSNESAYNGTPPSLSSMRFLFCRHGTDAVYEHVKDVLSVRERVVHEHIAVVVVTSCVETGCKADLACSFRHKRS